MPPAVDGGDARPCFLSRLDDEDAVEASRLEFFREFGVDLKDAELLTGDHGGLKIRIS